MGKCRARQDTLGEVDERGDTTACLLLHGDASFAGQGSLYFQFIVKLNYSQISWF